MKIFYGGEVQTHMTVQEAAAYLGVNESTIRYRIQRGDMRAERIGRRVWLIPREEVERQRRGKWKPGPAPTPTDPA